MSHRHVSFCLYYMVLVLTYFLVALSISFLCSILEAVLLSTPVSFISMKESEKARYAPLLRKLKQDIDRPISAILSLNTIAHTVGAAGVGSEAVKVFGEEYFGLISAILTILILVFSEIIPKTIGAYYWRSMALPSAPIIKGMIVVTYPLVLLSELITKIVSSKKPSASVSREEVSAMVTVGVEEGVFQVKENRIIQNLIKFGDIKSREIMTPSIVVATAHENMPISEFYKNKQFRHYSRIPVYGENRDYITGYVLRQTILEKLVEDKFEMRISEVVRPILSFSENDSISHMWESMLEKKEHITVIIDEYGCMRGIVTMEDIIETLLGLEIVDENDNVTDMQVLAREKWLKMKDRKRNK